MGLIKGRFTDPEFFGFWGASDQVSFWEIILNLKR
jgi:hypothetical protein